MRRWSPFPTSFLSTGEDASASPFSGGRAQRIENGLLTGAGSVVQVPDWVLAATCTDGANENDAAIYGFPFATQGGASAASAGVAFSFDTSGNLIFLHQLGEDSSILRTLTAYSSYVEAAPPQMTGFQMFGRAYFCEDGRESVANRKGLAYFDPAGAGSVTIPTFQLDAGPAAALRFKGISQHQKATILGWGYYTETTPDRSHCLRYCKYGDPTTWVPDGTPDSAGFVFVGTPDLPIIACAPSGPYSVIGKTSEIFRLSGSYEDQFALDPIGVANGPVSTFGMTATDDMAVWMSQNGPAVSVNGGNVQLLAHPRVIRRMQTYFDLSYACAAHDANNTRVGFLLRRRSTLDGTPITDFWGTQILWWDYARDAVTIQGTPTSCFCLFTTDGPGISLAGPSGTPVALASSVTSTSATLSWTHAGGDPTAQVSVEYRVAGTTPFTAAGPTSAGAVGWLVSGLSPGTTYDWRLRYVKNGQYGSYTATVQFTTSVASSVGTPSDFTGAVTNAYLYGGKLYSDVTFGWTPGEFASGAQTELYENTVNDFASATRIQTMSVVVVGTSVTKQQAVTAYFYWIRHVLGVDVGTEVPCTNNPIVYGPL